MGNSIANAAFALSAAIDFYGSETKQALAAAEELERASNRTQEGLLQQILTRVDKAVFVSKNTHLALQKALSLTRLSWLRHLGSELMAMMAKVQSITFKTYATVLSLNDKVTWLSSQTILLQEPCILTDALGRPSPLHVQFINCWDALDAVLEIRFRNLPGHDKILHKEYSLIDGQTGREMDRVRPLDTILVPGQQLQIEMIFHAARAWFTRDDSRDFLTEPADRTAHISGEFKASEATAIDLDASAHENGLHKSKKNHILNGVSCEDLLPFDASTALNIPIETACPFHLDEGVSYALLPGQEDPSLENSHLHKDGEKEILVAVTDLCNHLLPSDDNYSTLLVSLEEEHHPSTFQKARVLLPRAEQRRNVGGTYDHFPRQPNACVTVPCTTVDKGDQCESGEPQSSKYRSNVQTCSSGKLLDSDRMSVLRIPSEIGIGGKRSATQHPRPAQHVQSSNSRQKVRASHPDHMLRMPCLCSSIEKGPSTCLKAGSSLSSCRSLPNVIENDHKKRDINDGKFRQNQGANMRKTRRHLK